MKQWKNKKVKENRKDETIGKWKREIGTIILYSSVGKGTGN